MPPRLPVPADDAPRRLRILHLLADVLGSQAELAKAIGVERSTLSQWFGAKREPDGWAVVLQAAQKTIRRHPEHEAVLVRSIAAELLDVEGAWLPALESDDGRALLEVASEVVEIGARAMGAIRRNDADEVRAMTCDLANKAIGLAARSAA
jgi:transcriptional regulator with XRE-family HTH domain